MNTLGCKHTNWLALIALICADAIASTHVAAGGTPQLPSGFERQLIASGFDRPVGIAFAKDGRFFVTEQRGIVWVVQNGVVLAEPFIDLTQEVNGEWDRGLLGIAIDPDFTTNLHVYLLYVVDPIFGEPDESPQQGTFGRITRYTGTIDSDGNSADLKSRLVLLGAEPAEGFPVCDRSHAIGSLRFGTDGSMFASAGDAAHFEFTDDGGSDPECFAKGMFGEDEDIGAFRSQYLGSLAGKVLRIDPATGLGMPSNPHWTGDAADKRSKIWVNGLRNPYRFVVDPDSPAPGTLIVSDVGWYQYEEVNIAYGGENFGWPCFEGVLPTPNYPNSNPAHSGCDSIETPDNPGPLTDPVVCWHHFNPNLSCPPGMVGNAATACVFYKGPFYPPPFDNGIFFADYVAGSWIKKLQVDESDQLIAIHDFASDISRTVDLAAHPLNGDIYFVSLADDAIYRLRYVDALLGDLDGDCVVNISDLLALFANWGPCDACPADLDENYFVNTSDLLILFANWGPCG
ncbi:MAG: PQQ-dependent sugar dehydrogenase [Planctomycetes bacterium]|nr:PQQ-dependent sugar dehydrogenase [Planctomycetota bacterium]